MPKTTVACYYFPNYHVDTRNETAHGPGWTEWELVRRAEPRFPGHVQPRIPLWGETDEANPLHMAQKIDAAADHGVDAFIFDWYWYDDGPFLQRGLDEGFLGAANSARLKFALMWANHDWKNIHPAKLTWEPEKGPLQYPGKVTRETFKTIIDHVIENYFKHPSYWLIDGCPYFSIYELAKLLESFDGIAQTRDALDYFRQRVKQAGFPGLHLNAVVWSVRILPGETAVDSPNALLHALGFDSITSYVYIHHVKLEQFPETPYTGVHQAYMRYWDQAERDFDLPYFPNGTMGWDASPRTVQSDRYLNAGYPFMPRLGDNTPEAFEAALRDIKSRLDDRPADVPNILTINAWNEWTEGSYLEPDTEYGLGYLEAIDRVFGR